MPEISGDPGIIYSILGFLGLLVTAWIGPRAIENVKGKWAARNGKENVPAPGLNAPIDPHMPGVTGFGLQDMMNAVTSLQKRLDLAEDNLVTAHNEIGELQKDRARDKEIWKFVLQQVLDWGKNDTNPPPRVLTEPLRELLRSGGWIS